MDLTRESALLLKESSNLYRFSEYSPVQNTEGIFYVMPTKDATQIFYNPCECIGEEDITTNEISGLYL